MAIQTLSTQNSERVRNDKKLILLRIYTRESSKNQDLLAEATASCHISEMMEDLGYACCESQTTLKDVLQEFPELKEMDIALILGMMARTNANLESGLPFCRDFPASEPTIEKDKQDSAPKGWNTNVFIDVLKELVSEFCWQNFLIQLASET
jgi:hypothetical protein